MSPSDDLGRSWRLTVCYPFTLIELLVATGGVKHCRFRGVALIGFE